MNFEIEKEKIMSSIYYYKENEFDDKINANADIYIYGSGFMGNKYADELLKREYKVKAFFETSCSENTKICTLPVYTVEYKTGCVVLISSFKYYKAMKEKLVNLGYKDEQIISPIGAFEKLYISEYEYAFNVFEDELSKKIVIDKMKYHLIEPKMMPNSFYFDTEMFSNTEDDIFVDGGAFNGESAIEFAYLRNGKYKQIYCFEPIKSSYEISVENLKGFEKIEIVQKGLYSSETTLKFKDYGVDDCNTVDDFYMGHKWWGEKIDFKYVTLEVISLDSFFENKPKEEYPTIIKLDIEGSEKEALLGMKKILNVSHPKLIICAYHKIEDYYELARTIKEICPNYQLKLRHYTETALDSIIFGQYVE